MSLFKRKAPENEEIEIPDLTPVPPFEPHGEIENAHERGVPKKDAFPIPGGAHIPLHSAHAQPAPAPSAPARSVPAHSTPKPLVPARPSMPVPRPLPRPEIPKLKAPPEPEISAPVKKIDLDSFKDEYEVLEPMDEEEPVVTGRENALEELEELLRPGTTKARSVSGLVKIADVTEPEILKAFVDLVGNPITVSVIDGLVETELSLEEIAAHTNTPPEKVNTILQQLVCLGLVEEFWYRTPSGKHINKFKFVNTTGTLDFDLRGLGSALSVQKLDDMSATLVDLVSREGKVPRSLVIKELGLEEDSHLDQVVRFTERFKLPNVRGLITDGAEEIEEVAPPVEIEPKLVPLSERAVAPKSGFEEDFEALEHYMKKLETVKK